ncbi:MAG TPA: hypothetical protein VMF30_13570 [Pirellulales bacterium]|nr:hypothetical protein [Pirellulales bacterium]
MVHFEIVRKFDPRLDGDEIRATLIVRHSDGKSFTFRGNVAPADKRGEKWEVEVAVDEAAGAVLTIDVPSPDGRKLDTAYEIHLGDF